MNKDIVVVSSTLGSALTNDGTTTFTLPTGYDESMIAKGGHKLVVKNGGSFDNDAEFNVSVAGSTVTLTNRTEATIPAGSEVFLELKLKGNTSADPRPDFGGKVGNVQTVMVNLGAPATADADGVCASQAGTANTNMTIDGALASGGVATFDVPRNVVAAWTNTAVLTVTGTDEYGNVIVESSESGTSMVGKKAFKTITRVVPSANITGATVGTGDVLGLPFFLPSAGYILKEFEDGAAATPGTTVAGVQTEPTATTGDVRGTYDPNSACNGDKNFSLLIAVEGELHRGADQYAG